jgi:membrane protein YdbS with pleckstrin-like domain
MGLITTTASMVAFLNSIVAGVGVAMLAGGLLREQRTVVASLIGAGVALVLMALFFVYQKWRYDATTAHMQAQDGPSGEHGPAA